MLYVTYILSSVPLLLVLIRTAMWMRLIIQVHPDLNRIFCFFSTHSQVLRRRRNAYPIEMGIISAINAVPHLPPFQTKMEEMEYSLYITGKESEWSCDVV